MNDTEINMSFGDAVECRTHGEEWIGGFFFIAYIPQLSRPFLVRGAINGDWDDKPPRLHAECRKSVNLDQLALIRKDLKNRVLIQSGRANG